MAIKSTVANGVIIPNLRADIMRKSMQPKGFLQHKGGIYVGTGQVDSIQAGSDTYHIYKTTEVYPTDDTPAGTPLVTEPTATGGLSFGKVAGSVISDNSIPLSKLYAKSADNGKVLTCNVNGTVSFSSLENLIPDGSLKISKLEAFCDPSVHSTDDESISIQLVQHALTNQLYISTLKIDYDKLAKSIVNNTDTMAAFQEGFAEHFAENFTNFFVVIDDVLILE